MPFKLFISEEAREQLRHLSDDNRRQIGYRVQLLQDDFFGDIKKLKGPDNLYRLRVGAYRILFHLDGGN